MPWMFVPNRRPRRNARGRYANGYEDRYDDFDNPYADDNGDGNIIDDDQEYVDDYDGGDNYYQRRNRRRRSISPTRDDFDGFFDRDGNPISLTIQTPSDMLPPQAAAADYAPIRRRARF